MSGDSVLFESQDGIAWLTLNRPQFHNAIDLQTRDQLWSLLEVAALDNEISVLIFRGAGHTAFSAGADLRDFGTAPSLAQSRQARRERDLWRRLASFEKPMIAAVHGYALGAGCELSLYCDFRVAADDAVFGLPEVSLGYIPAAGGTQTTPRTIGIGRAMEMMATGTPISAQRALEWGLVYEVVSADELDAAAEALARRLLAQPAEAVRAVKAAVLHGMDLTLEQGLAVESAMRAKMLSR